MFVVVFCFIVPSLLLTTSCTDKDPTTAFCNLEEGQTLNVGSYTKYKNYQETRDENYYVEYYSNSEVTLERYTYQYSSYSFYYDGYYYVWEYDTTKNNYLVGTKTILISTIYSYLLYGSDNNSIVVKKTQKTKTILNFTTREVELPCEITYKLNGYFNSIQELQNKALGLFEKLKISPTTKHIIEEPVVSYDYSEQAHNNTYYYFT